MKKLNVLTRMLLLVALLVGSISAWGATSTVTASRISSTSAQWTGSADETWNVSVTGGALDQNVTSGYAQVGTKSSPSTSITFSTNGISGTITSIVINCASYSGLATVGCTVGGNNFGTQSQATPSWSNNTGGNITFSGSASGTIVVTMTNGNSGRAMYVKSITVTYSSGPSISASDMDIAFNATSGEFGYTLNNPVDGGVLSADDNADWITNVAVNTGTNKVTFNTTANTNPTPRVGTITMTYKKGNEILATKEVTITQAKAVVILNYSLATQVVPGRHYIITSGKTGDVKVMGAQNSNNRAAVDIEAGTNTISVSSDAGVCEFVIAGDVTTGYYTIYDIENDGYLYAASSGSNYLRIQTELDANGKWTIYIDNDGVATIKAQGTNSRNWMQYNSNNDIFACYESNTQTLVYLFERVGDTSIQEFPVTITEAGYASYSNPFALDLTNVPGLTAYKATATSESSVTLEDVTGIVPAKTGLLLKGDKATYYIPVSVETPTANVNGNLLQSTATEEYTVTGSEKGTAYVFGSLSGNVGFYKAAVGKTVGVGKSWLLVPGTGGAKDVEFLSFVFGDEEQGETDGIKAVSTKVENGVRYNLAGQKVGADYKGIVIVNGKKFVVK